MFAELLSKGPFAVVHSRDKDGLEAFPDGQGHHVIKRGGEWPGPRQVGWIGDGMRVLGIGSDDIGRDSEAGQGGQLPFVEPPIRVNLELPGDSVPLFHCPGKEVNPPDLARWEWGVDGGATQDRDMSHGAQAFVA